MSPPRAVFFFSLLKKTSANSKLGIAQLECSPRFFEASVPVHRSWKKTCFQDLIDSLLVAYLEQNSVLFFLAKKIALKMPHLFLVPLGVYFKPFCPGLLEVCDEKNVLSGSTGGDRTVCYVGSEKLRIMGVFPMSFWGVWRFLGWTITHLEHEGV